MTAKPSPTTTFSSYKNTPDFHPGYYLFLQTITNYQINNSDGCRTGNVDNLKSFTFRVTIASIFLFCKAEKYCIASSKSPNSESRDKRIIFKNTNEKQEKVASNLLMWFREKLGLLSGKERVYHPVVALLNTETCSPLKGRIIMGAEKITGGFKAQQVITILDKSDVINIAGIPLEDDKMLQMISEYLTGWEDAVGAKIAERDKELGAFSKIAGLRFMILLLPAFYDQAVNEKRKFSRQFISKKLNMLFKKEGMEPRDIFAKDSAYIKALGNNPFAGETPTTLLAKEWIAKLKNSASTDFDPLA